MELERDAGAYLRSWLQTASAVASSSDREAVKRVTGPSLRASLRHATAGRGSLLGDVQALPMHDHIRPSMMISVWAAKGVANSARSAVGWAAAGTPATSAAAAARRGSTRVISDAPCEHQC